MSLLSILTIHTQACDSGVFTGDYHRELPDQLGLWHAEFAVCGVFTATGISAGAILGLASYFLTDTLDFRNEPRAAPRALGQTRPKKERIRCATKKNTTTATSNTKVPARVLFPQVIPTILEEEDEDSPFLVSGAGGKRRTGRVKRATGWSSEEEEEYKSSG
ncbi:hypothetical protein B9Z19DRAFT_1068792 [Tuber borchii]|uniref:Uncharacterized protein n=1 Tax=Tuber borchii TaxID=42251 RepID=A0A2T6ZDV8_TUBBO|nr:hypothetical protein B9Z19DRAFT_1068792 [Tuber borchii]